MQQQIRFRVVVYCDTEIEAKTPQDAWKRLQSRVQDIVNREYKDQMEGREADPETDDFLYGLTLRLPGSMVVTGLDMKPGYEKGDLGYDERPERRPQLTMLHGGKR